MTRMIRTLAIAVVASMMLALGVGTATAAPTQKGVNTITSGLLGLAGALGVVVSPTGTARQTAAGLEFPVVGNTAATGTLMSVGGIQLSKPDGSTLQLSNAHLDLDTLEVSMVVDEGERVTIFQGTQLSPNSVSLAFTQEGAAIIGGFFGLPAETFAPGGPFNVFGTSTTTADLP